MKCSKKKVLERKKAIVVTKLPKLQGRREKKFKRNCGNEATENEGKKICGNGVAENWRSQLGLPTT